MNDIQEARAVLSKAPPVPATRGQRLLVELDAVVGRIFAEMEQDRFFSRFLDGTMRREEYAYFLVQTYHYVMITPSTYQWSLEQMKKEPKPHYGPFLTQFEEHWKEEIGHDHWLLEDLKALGFDAEQLVMDIPANRAVEAYTAVSRFFTSGPVPLATLGQDYFLESMAQRYGERIYKGLVAGGIPNVDKALKFIVGHGELDIHHMEMNREAIALIEDEAEADAIRLMCESIGRFYATIGYYYAQQAVSALLHPKKTPAASGKGA